MTRLFVAVWPTPEVVATLAAVRRADVEGLRWTRADQWHVTLRFLGEAAVEDATRALSQVDARAATAVMGPATARFGRRILHVPVAGLDEVAAAVRSAFGPEDRPFNGHLTLARARGRRGVDLRALCETPLAGEWPVAEITLVASRLHPEGARYEVLERVPLGR